MNKIEVYTYPEQPCVVLNLTMQEAALVSLLLGATPPCGPGQELYDALCIPFPVGGEEGLRVKAARSVPLINTTNPNILAYLGQYPGD